MPVVEPLRGLRHHACEMRGGSFQCRFSGAAASQHPASQPQLAGPAVLVADQTGPVPAQHGEQVLGQVRHRPACRHQCDIRGDAAQVGQVDEQGKSQAFDLHLRSGEHHGRGTAGAHRVHAVGQVGVIAACDDPGRTHAEMSRRRHGIDARQEFTRIRAACLQEGAGAARAEQRALQDKEALATAVQRECFPPFGPTLRIRRHVARPEHDAARGAIAGGEIDRAACSSERFHQTDDVVVGEGGRRHRCRQSCMERVNPAGAGGRRAARPRQVILARPRSPDTWGESARAPAGR